MKKNLPVFIISLLVFFACHPGELKATPERMFGTETTNPITTADGFFNLSTDYPCYPPNWTYTFNITETSATWQWENCNGANGYFIQWRYANGTWHDIPGMCYQNWYTCNNLDPSNNYEWRCRANCGYNYYSDRCYPVYFTTNGYHCNYPEWLSCNNITEYSATWQQAGCYGAEYNTTPVAHISPNPVRDVLKVSLVQTHECIVSGLVMTDVSGKVMKRKTYQSKGSNEFNDELNVAGWTPGIYVLQILTTTGIITEKVSVITN